MEYRASDEMPTARSFTPIEYFPMEPGPLIGNVTEGFYGIELPGNFGSGVPYFYTLVYQTPLDWRDSFPYPIPSIIDNRENWGPKDTTYLTHPGLEISALFEYGKTEILGFPLGTQFTEYRYYVSDGYYEFLRSVLLETDWRGVNLLQAVPANVPTNLSNGARGYFFAVDSYEVVSEIRG